MYLTKSGKKYVMNEFKKHFYTKTDVPDCHNAYICFFLSSLYAHTHMNLTIYMDMPNAFHSWRKKNKLTRRRFNDYLQGNKAFYFNAASIENRQATNLFRVMVLDAFLDSLMEK